MIKKIYRRFLLAAIMLLMAVSLICTGPRAWAQDPCQDCMDNCAAIYQSCTDQGYPFNVCSSAARQCSINCFNNECQTR